MFRYKPDQGIYARGTAFWVFAAYAGLAGYRLHLHVQRWDWANVRWSDGNVPVLGFPMMPSFVVGLVVFCALAYVAWRVVNLPRLANLLVDTEQEMKKVTWPSFEDSKNASYVVIGCVVFMLIFLAMVDFGLGYLFRTLIY